ncbi:MAG TPA: hypothetical protein VGL82_21505 [Bryobacteraceae bacterium]
MTRERVPWIVSGTAPNTCSTIRRRKPHELDNQAKLERFAGQNGKVSGKPDAAGKTIHVENTTRSNGLSRYPVTA